MQKLTLKHYWLILVSLFFGAFLSSCAKEDTLSSVAANNANVTTRTSTTLPFFKGVDLSYANELENVGVAYKEDSVTKDVYKIMNNYGANLLRVRLWHNYIFR